MDKLSLLDFVESLWELGKSGNNIMELKLPSNTEGSPLAVFDSTGLVFGVSAGQPDKAGYVSLGGFVVSFQHPLSHSPTQFVNLYDARNYAAGPFAEMRVAR